MRGKIKLFAGTIVIAALFGIGGFLYATRDIAAPSADIQDTAVELETSDAGAGEIVAIFLQLGLSVGVNCRVFTSMTLHSRRRQGPWCWVRTI